MHAYPYFVGQRQTPFFTVCRPVMETEMHSCKQMQTESAGPDKPECYLNKTNFLKKKQQKKRSSFRKSLHNMNKYFLPRIM